MGKVKEVCAAFGHWQIPSRHRQIEGKRSELKKEVGKKKWAGNRKQKYGGFSEFK